MYMHNEGDVEYLACCHAAVMWFYFFRCLYLFSQR